MFVIQPLLCACLVTSAVITNLIDVQTARLDHSCAGRTFDVTAPVLNQLYPDKGLLLLGDERGVAEFDNRTDVRDDALRRGDVVRVRGVLRPFGRTSLHANCQDVRVLTHGPVPQPKPISIKEFLDGRHDYHLSELTGTVKDIFRDELDPMFSFLVLLADDETIYVPLRHAAPNVRPELPPAGSEVALVGTPMRDGPLNRRYLGRYFFVHDPDSIRILKPAPEDNFRFPDLHDALSLRPQEISRLGTRRASGRVLCTMQDGSFLLRVDPDLIVRVETTGPGLPSPGQAVEVVGYPESNLFHLDLIRSTWRSLPTSAELRPDDTAPAEHVFSHGGKPISSSTWHGHLVKFAGRVLRLPDAESADRILRLETADQIVSVDLISLTNALHDVTRDCTLEVTGICVLDFETWRPNAALPRVKGFTVVPRSDADIRIVARPPWWTPQRLFILLCILLPIILASVILNFILRRLVERRSRALLREQSAKLTETLRVDERTRLAAELHDSVAQDLTGISMQIETAEDLAADAPEKLRRILGTASRSLLNCREELRNCLWDLRNHALDERNMGDAITRTLKPHLEGVELTLRFNVPRNDVSDATAHATLQIIRELATNAIRHGHAKHLRVCGTIDTKRLTFSFSDDGCGFDPDTVPGAAQGHFGLTGIRERIRKLGGTIAIQSSAETGTKFTITL